MAIINTPITLPANFYYSTVTQMILESQVVDNQNIADWQTKLHSYMNKGGFANGNGRIYRYLKDKTNPVVDRPVGTNGTPATNAVNPFAYRNTKEFFETTITVDKREFTLLTYDLLGTTGESFESSTRTNDFITLMLDSNEYTIKDKFSAIELALWNGDKGVNAGQTKTVKTYDLTQITDPSTQQWAVQYNSTAIKVAYDELMDSITVKSTGKYTDEVTQATQVKKNSLVSIFNKEWIRQIAKGGVQMFNPEAVDYMLPNGDRIELPADVVTNANRIATIATPERHNLFEGYRAGYPLINPVLGDQTNFDHYEYGTGIIKYAPFIELVADPSLTV